MFDTIILSCEHGGCRVPAAYRHHFVDAERVLPTHRGYDIGALPVARRLAKRLEAPLYFATVTRLLVDLNRSLHHPKLCSSYVTQRAPAERQRLLDTFYHPHRKAITRAVATEIQQRRRVLHIAVHSFTPVLQGQHRNADVGLLYDPGRTPERALALAWQRALQRCAPEWTIRRNYPYRGVADGLTRQLRARFPAARYMGVELELNQRSLDTAGNQVAIADCIARSLRGLSDSEEVLHD